MRILSQGGLQIQDLPYEKTRVYIEKDRIAVKGLFDGIIFELAKYSTEEKARKAMEMLRGAYCGAVYMKHADYEIADIDLSQELEKKIREEMSKSKFLTTIPNPVIECKIFQFPQDNEIEV